MKNNPIFKLSQLAMIIPAVLLLLSSCQQDEPYNPPAGSTLVNLSVSASNSGVASASGDPASVIKTLCILQFNASGGGFGTLRHVGIGKESTAGKYSATLLRSTDENDRYKFVVLANFPQGYGIFQGMAGQSYAAVRQVCLSAEENIPVFDGNNCFPMFGIPKDGTPEVIDETLDLGAVSLVRAVARVDIGIGTKMDANTWNKNGVPFDMTQVQIWKGGKQYAYMPLANNFSSSGGILTISAPSPVGNVDTKVYGGTHITSETYCSEKIYLPEADLQWGNAFDANHTNRLAIIVGGKYNGSQQESFYRVDFIRDDNGKMMDILRNHAYQFTIRSVTDEGYSSAELAYTSKPINIYFTLAVEAWKTGVTEKPQGLLGNRLVYEGINGSFVAGTIRQNISGTVTDVEVNIGKLGNKWIGRIPTTVTWEATYDDFSGESNNVYAQSNRPQDVNGDLYPTLEKAIQVEGVFPDLMVASDDLTTPAGDPTVPWKDSGNRYVARNLCRNYAEYGFRDWRMPRLSELVFIFLNQSALDGGGYNGLSGNYWSDSEYAAMGTIIKDNSSADAWSFNVDNSTYTSTASPQTKTTSLKVRCVRQVK